VAPLDVAVRGLDLQIKYLNRVCVNREQKRAESREQGAESREQRVESRKKRAESREQQVASGA
jgi:hypothetical protein